MGFQLNGELAMLAKVGTLYLIWILVSDVFRVGFTIWKFFRSLSELEKANDLMIQYLDTHKRDERSDGQ